MNTPGLDIILGPMFSCKTTELLRRLSTVTEVGLKVLYINNVIDDRNTQDVFSTHNKQLKQKLSRTMKMTSVKRLEEADSLVDVVNIVGIDEAHFFDDLSKVIEWVEVKQKRVIIVSLDGDWQRCKIGKIYDLIPLCDTVTKLSAYCISCAKSGKLVNGLFSCRVVNDNNTILVGGNDKYQAVCRECYLKVNQPMNKISGK